MEKTRADTLGIHLILRSRDRKEQVVLRDADASKTVVILETGANYSSSAPAPHPGGVSTTVHDSTTFRLQLQLALFTLRPRAPTPRRPRSSSFHPVPRLFFLPFSPLSASSSCRFSSKVTASNDRPRDRVSVSRSRPRINMNATSFGSTTAAVD